MSKLLPLKGTVKHYPWGKSLKESLVATFSGALDDSQKYAELWFGSHPNGPSEVTWDGRNQSLSSLLESEGTTILGKEGYNRFGSNLPFLFKVLSIGDPLSIQAHPTKELAKKLHALQPEHYPDENHKPEVAIALSPVELLYGFLPWKELQHQITTTPEFHTLLRSDLIEEVLSKPELDQTFEKFLFELFTIDSSLLEKACIQLYQRIRNENLSDPRNRWVLSLEHRYPKGDVGILFFFLMRLEVLQEGEGVFIGPNIPHAYLSGDLVECMANSDNVVRAGLTPKHKDFNTLIAMTSRHNNPFQRLTSLPNMNSIFENFSFTAEEFALGVAKGNVDDASQPATPGPQVLFCQKGVAEVWTDEEKVKLSTGEALLIVAHTPYHLTLASGTLFLRAHTLSFLFKNKNL